MSELLKYDQLRKQMNHKKSEIFSEFSEMPISFLPTYKYDPRSQNFDSSEKRRKPSYTDRILFTGGESLNSSTINIAARKMVHVEPLSYYSVSKCLHGDHRPVCAKFRVQFPQSP